MIKYMIKKSFLVLMLVLNFVVFNTFVYAESCDYSIEVLMDKGSFSSDEFNFQLRAVKVEGVPTVFAGTANIEDSGGKIVKEYKPWSNQTVSIKRTSSKYSPNLQPGDYKVNAEIGVECDDTDLSNNEISREFTILGGSGETTTTVTTSSTTATSTTATTTSTTTSTTIPANALPISSTSTTSTSSASITIPLPPTTSTTVTSTTATLIQLTNEKTTATTALKEKITSAAVKTKNTESNIDDKNSRIVFEDSSGLIKKIAIFLLIGLSIVLNIILIWKR